MNKIVNNEHETHDIEVLRNSAATIQEHLNRLPEKREIQRLMDEILVRKGWTTPAEFQLVGAGLQAIQSQVQILESTIDAVVKGADMVGR